MTASGRICTSLLTFVALAVASGAASSTAPAATPDFVFAGCLADGGANGCTNVNPGSNPLNAPQRIATIGSSVYATAQGSDSVSQFRRNADGSLSFVACFANAGANGCADPSPGQSPLTDPQGVAVSPDGTSVYVVARSSDSISHFSRDPDGTLHFGGCIAGGGAHGCTNPSVGNNPFGGPWSVVVSPGAGTSVYVTSLNEDSVSEFTRTGNGSLTFAGCVADGGINGCTDPSPGNDPLRGATGIAVSSGGTSVYVTSNTGVSHFTRAMGGGLTFAGCIADVGAEGCTDPSPGQFPLGTPDDVVVSPDGGNVYVNGNTLASFTRGAGGSLAFTTCFANGGAGGCVDPSPGNALLGTGSSLALDAQGTRLYVPDQNSGGNGSLSSFARAPNGTLNFAGCVANGGVNGCADPHPGSTPMTFPAGVETSPDGGNIYLLASGSNSISRFRRNFSVGPGAGSAAPIAPPPPKKKCKRKKARKGAAVAKKKKKCKRRKKGRK